MTQVFNRKYVKPDDVLVQYLNGEAVLLNMRNGRYYGLDAVGCRMFQVLVNSENVEAALKVLLEEYDVAEAQLKIDFDNLIQHLFRNGLVIYGETKLAKT
jgi:hypothetical protein